MLHSGTVHADQNNVTARSVADLYALLKVLLTGHYELTETVAEQAQRLRAILLRGDGSDRALSRTALPDGALTTLVCRRPPQGATESQIERHAEMQQICHVILAYRAELSANRKQMTAVVNELAPGVTDQRGTGPIKAAKVLLETHRRSQPPESHPPSDWRTLVPGREADPDHRQRQRPGDRAVDLDPIRRDCPDRR